MPTLEDRLEDLERRVQTVDDRDAIRELTARYCQAVVGEDMEALLALFTEDGVLETHFPPGAGRESDRTSGIDALREAYQGTAGMSLRPCVHNHVVEVDGDAARGFCSVEIRLVQDGTAYTAAGHYEDRYRREDGTWRFAERNLTLYHWVPHTQGWA